MLTLFSKALHWQSVALHRVYKCLQATNLQNETAWADLGKDVDMNNDDDEEPEGDKLWDEFRSREQDKEQRV